MEETSTEQKCFNASIVTSNNLSDTLPSLKEQNRGWSEGDITSQKSGASGNYIVTQNILTENSQKQHFNTSFSMLIYACFHLFNKGRLYNL